jgi:hypothetical protein
MLETLLKMLCISAVYRMTAQKMSKKDHVTIRQCGRLDLDALCDHS